MHTTNTLFFTLSALVATSYARPSVYDPSAPVVGAIFAGAPTDGTYPVDMEDAAGWEPETYVPVHAVEPEAAGPPPAVSHQVNIPLCRCTGIRLLTSWTGWYYRDLVNYCRKSSTCLRSHLYNHLQSLDGS